MTLSVHESTALAKAHSAVNVSPLPSPFGENAGDASTVISRPEPAAPEGPIDATLMTLVVASDHATIRSS